MSGYDKVEWEKGECNGAPLNLFFILEENRAAANWLDPEAIRRVCGGCEIWKQCLTYALGNEDYGLWGGLLTKERNALKKRDNSPLREKAIQHLAVYGITRKEIEEAVNEYTGNERSVENKLTDDGENDSTGNC